MPIRTARQPVVRGSGQLPWPVNGPVVQPFGVRVDPHYRTATRNQGIEMAPVGGQPVRAVDSGLVSFADEFVGHGMMVILDHGTRLHSIYSGMADIGVSVGQRVGRGEQLGTAGDTLHFEFRVGGKSVDPLEWLTPRQ